MIVKGFRPVPEDVEPTFGSNVDAPLALAA
jgi:hypothetical protein